MTEPVLILIGMGACLAAGWFLRGLLAPATVTRWITSEQQRGKNGRFQKTVS